MTTLGLLLVLFIALKLCAVITWSWWWVLSPMWGMPLILGVVGGTFFGIKIKKEKKSGRK